MFDNPNQPTTETPLSRRKKAMGMTPTYEAPKEDEENSMDKMSPSKKLGLR